MAREKSAPLELRRRPKTARAEAAFERILLGALDILAEEGLDKLTTRRVAERTGTNVATVYAYFPNKQAIVSAAFERWAGKVLVTADAAAEAHLGKVSLGEFYDLLLIALHGFDLDLRVWLALNRAMLMYSELTAIEAAHRDAVAERIAGYMRHYGSTWSDASLLNLGRILYPFDNMMVAHLAEIPPENWGPSVEIGRAAGKRLFERALEPDPADGGPDNLDPREP